MRIEIKGLYLREVDHILTAISKIVEDRRENDEELGTTIVTLIEEEEE